MVASFVRFRALRTTFAARIGRPRLIYGRIDGSDQLSWGKILAGDCFWWDHPPRDVPTNGPTRAGSYCNASVWK